MSYALHPGSLSGEEPHLECRDKSQPLLRAGHMVSLGPDFTSAFPFNKINPWGGGAGGGDVYDSREVAQSGQKKKKKSWRNS